MHYIFLMLSKRITKQHHMIRRHILIQFPLWMMISHKSYKTYIRSYKSYQIRGEKENWQGENKRYRYSQNWPKILQQMMIENHSPMYKASYVCSSQWCLLHRLIFYDLFMLNFSFSQGVNVWILSNSHLLSVCWLVVRQWSPKK